MTLNDPDMGASTCSPTSVMRWSITSSQCISSHKST